MLDQATVRRVLERALSTGADFAEIFAEDRENTNLSYVDKKVDSINQGRVYGLGLRIIRGFEVIYAYTSDLSEKNLLDLATRASQAFDGKAGQKTVEFKALPEGKLLPIKTQPGSVPLKQKLALLERGYKAALAYDAIISQAKVDYLDHTQHVLIANSEGLWTEDTRTRTRYMVSSVASVNDGMQTGYYGPGAGQGFEFFENHDVEEIAREASRIAKTMAHADYAPAGAMPVIMDNGFGGVLFHEACGHGLEAAFVSKKISVYTDKLGQQVASSLVTAIDDGTIPNGWGTLNIDDEGTPTRRNILIENGVLKSYLVDRLNGKRMGMASTGSSRRESYRYAPTSRMNNTFIDAGSSTREEIIKATPYGLYAKSMGGGSVDITTGAFNFAVMEGYLIEDGKITKPVRGASLIGTGLEVLQKIDMVGQELKLGQGMCGAGSGMIPANVGQPPLRISQLTVGGR
jgi:TldD protein